MAVSADPSSDTIATAGERGQDSGMRATKRFLSIDGAQALARRRVPRSVYEFIEGGTDGSLTLKANRQAYESVVFRPRAAVFVPEPELAVTVLGSELAMPVIVAPAGMIGMAHTGGEVAAARAAGKLGTAVGVSTLSSYPIDEITAATAKPVWYQLYFAGGKTGAEIAIDRAKSAGCTALLVTVDLAASARRERSFPGGEIPQSVDLRNVLRYAPQMVIRPRWLLDFWRAGMRLETPNVRIDPEGPALSAAAASASMRATAPTWSDLEWIREQWPGPIAIKGILSPDDARRSRDSGVDGIVVSNHGGNALDGLPATLRVLPAIVDAVGDDLEVLMDGGIRRGSDVVKAMALGARAVLVGRSYIWGLAAGGEPGVYQALKILRDGVRRTLGLLGCSGVSELDRSFVGFPEEWL
jgi:isopentenyl diphosphate isomerase/L-lactate dehydrogenase-like FMN-dependent dehydrogenase